MARAKFIPQEYREFFANDKDAPPCLKCSDKQLAICAEPSRAEHTMVHGGGARNIGCTVFSKYASRPAAIRRT